MFNPKNETLMVWSSEFCVSRENSEIPNFSKEQNQKQKENQKSDSEYFSDWTPLIVSPNLN